MNWKKMCRMHESNIAYIWIHFHWYHNLLKQNKTVCGWRIRLRCGGICRPYRACILLLLLLLLLFCSVGDVSGHHPRPITMCSVWGRSQQVTSFFSFFCPQCVCLYNIQYMCHQSQTEKMFFWLSTQDTLNMYIYKSIYTVYLEYV